MEPSSSTPVIDACAFHDWVSKEDLLPYVGKGWADLLAIETVRCRRRRRPPAVLPLPTPRI
jgi:hypothetical protein